MKLLVTAVVFTVVASGCAVAPAEPFNGPSGKQAFSITCTDSMGYQSTDACYKKAGQLCPSGYTIVGNDTGPSSFVFVGNVIAPVAGKQTMAIECK